MAQDKRKTVPSYYCDCRPKTQPFPLKTSKCEMSNEQKMNNGEAANVSNRSEYFLAMTGTSYRYVFLFVGSVSVIVELFSGQKVRDA